MKIDLTCYLVTDTAQCGTRGLAKTVRAALPGGVTVVQLREPDAPDDVVVARGRELREELLGTGVPLLIDDRVHLVHEIGADGAHIGQSDMDPEEARRLLGPGLLLGLSVGTVEQAEMARDVAHLIDYVGVGPVWLTSTKPSAKIALGLDGLARVVAAAPRPAVAIGGIDAARTAGIPLTGAAGIAIVSAICAADDPGAAARELRTAWDSNTS